MTQAVRRGHGRSFFGWCSGLVQRLWGGSRRRPNCRLLPSSRRHHSWTDSGPVARAAAGSPRCRRAIPDPCRQAQARAAARPLSPLETACIPPDPWSWPPITGPLIVPRSTRAHPLPRSFGLGSLIGFPVSRCIERVSAHERFDLAHGASVRDVLVPLVSGQSGYPGQW